MNIYEDILNHIVSAYGSLREPKFFFKERVVKLNPYSEFKRSLSGIYHVDEDVDLDDEQCFLYSVSNGSEQWTIELSMVGPYALMFRWNRKRELITRESKSVSQDERNMLGLLNNFSIVLLDENMLGKGVPLNLNMETKEVTIYNALFSELGTLPWIEVLK